MNYELAKQLKDAGFPQGEGARYIDCGSYDDDELCREDGHIAFAPTLSELIEACGDAQQGSGFLFLSHNATTPNERWFAEGRLVQEGRITNKSATGSTPEEAVSHLWLAINKHSPEEVRV